MEKKKIVGIFLTIIIIVGMFSLLPIFAFTVGILPWLVVCALILCAFVLGALAWEIDMSRKEEKR